jgi:hypothetical protein
MIKGICSNIQGETSDDSSPLTKIGGEVKDMMVGGYCLHCNVFCNPIHRLTGKDVICNDCQLIISSKDEQKQNKRYKD